MTFLDFYLWLVASLCISLFAISIGLIYISPNTEKEVVKIASVDFEKNMEWELDDGESKFYATIEDEVFISDVEAGKIAFSNGMSLEVEIESRQMTVDKDIQTRYFITRVYKIIKPDEQLGSNF